MELLHKDITDSIISNFYAVHSSLGYGFLEKVYENSMLYEMQQLGLECKYQYSIPVYYEKVEVVKYYADIIVENKVIIELKSCPLTKEHEYQLLNYLKATEIEVGLLLSFGKKASFVRKVFSNKNK